MDLSSVTSVPSVGLPSGLDLQNCRLDGGGISVVLSFENGGLPRIAYWGGALPDAEDLHSVACATGRSVLQASLDQPAPMSVFPETGSGTLLHPALLAKRIAHGATSAFSSRFAVTGVEADGVSATITAEDEDLRARLTIFFELDADTGVFTLSSQLENTGTSTLQVDWLAAPALPVSETDSTLAAWHGRWCGEFQREASDWQRGLRAFENRTGRTSHEMFPGLISFAPDAGLDHGAVQAMHLAWSGNWRLIAEETALGERQVQAGILYLPGECLLPPGEIVCTPDIVAVRSGSGENGVAGKLHRHVRQSIIRHPRAEAPRPVHFNSWEAVYFDHRHDKLAELADTAADLGAERFVLDDGWFPGRDNDRAGLGDWFIDRSKYPDGLGPLIDHVQDLGMSFGLWVEPEMVNADSDLFRQHPDWVLQAGAGPLLEGRQQLVLDIAKPEVADYLFGCLDSILAEYAIAYLKWDMNRIYTDPGRDGAPVAAAQVHALYALLSRLRTAHPEVEIESCASGGGRIDYGVLRHTERFWLSDNNDTHDRWPMHDEATVFFPPEVFGFHVGPAPAHTSGRVLPMAFRAWSAAVGGHMGLELDVTRVPVEDRATLKAAIAFHKTWRHVLHKGRHARLELADTELSGRITHGEDTQSFVVSIVQSATLSRKESAPVRLSGLDPDAFYRVRFADGLDPASSGCRRPGTSDLCASGLVLSGQSLMASGFRLPVGWPDSIWVLTGERVTAPGHAGEPND